jgi:TolB-like protein/DNA-binding SARP family transcriptional activator
MAQVNRENRARARPTNLSLRVLGGLELRDADNRPVPFRTRKSGLLLAFLALSGEKSHSRDQLAGIFWGDRQDEQARGSLRNALSDIRKAIGEEGLVVGRESVALRRDVLSTDGDRLREAAEGTAPVASLADIYPGELLEGIELDTEEFATWLRHSREKFRRLAMSALELEIVRLEAARLLPAALDRARELLSLDALREESHRHLIRLYAASGERSLAVAQFRNCQALIRRELGTEPSRETVALAEGIAAATAEPLSPTRPAPLEPRIDHGDLSIAVLPFANMSGDIEQDYFSDGISEDVVTDLSRIADLHVAARSSTAIYKGAPARPDKIAAELGVRFILDGSVRKSGKRLRITAQLVDGRSGRQLWAERYDRELTDIFDLQDEISSSIVEALKLKLTPSEARAIGKRATRNVEAYEEYLRGRACLREMTRRGVELSKQIFARAVALDPTYAAAYAGLADSASMLAFHYDDAMPGLTDAIANSRRALELDPELAEAYAARGRARSILNEIAPAEEDFQKAMAIDPRLHEAHFYMALMYLQIGRPADALAPMRVAFGLADQELQTGMMTMVCLRANGLRDETMEVAARMVRVAERRIAADPSDERAAYVGAFALAELARFDEARAWAERAAAFDTGDARTRYNLACLFSILGDIDRSIDQLGRMLRPGYARHKITWARHHDPDLDNARKDPRFGALFADLDEP